jgi:hypothetical protein
MDGAEPKDGTEAHGNGQQNYATRKKLVRENLSFNFIISWPTAAAQSVLKYQS